METSNVFGDSVIVGGDPCVDERGYFMTALMVNDCPYATSNGHTVYYPEQFMDKTVVVMTDNQYYQFQNDNRSLKDIYHEIVGTE